MPTEPFMMVVGLGDPGFDAVSKLGAEVAAVVVAMGVDNPAFELLGGSPIAATAVPPVAPAYGFDAAFGGVGLTDEATGVDEATDADEATDDGTMPAGRVNPPPLLFNPSLAIVWLLAKRDGVNEFNAGNANELACDGVLDGLDCVTAAGLKLLVLLEPGFAAS